MPQSIEAFFYVEGCTGQQVLSRPCSGAETARERHAKFLAKFKMSANAVPLLVLRPDNWEEPFAVECDGTSICSKEEVKFDEQEPKDSKP